MPFYSSRKFTVVAAVGAVLFSAAFGIGLAGMLASPPEESFTGELASFEPIQIQLPAGDAISAQVADREAVGRAFIGAWADQDQAKMKNLGTTPEAIKFALSSPVDPVKSSIACADQDPHSPDRSHYQCDFTTTTDDGYYILLQQDDGQSSWYVWWAGHIAA